MSVSDSTIFNNVVGVQAQAGTTIRLTGNNIFDNGANLSCASAGQVLSAGNNAIAGGGGGCPPSGTFLLQ